MQDKIHVLPVRKIEEPERASRYNLPAPLTSLIGREHEVAAACALLRRPEVRLLTLSGTGGVGKTRLALEVATELRDDFADGVCFVSLAPICDPDLVLPTLAQTFDLKEIPDWVPLEHLKASLREKQLLLLLDNFEQVIAAAPLMVELLQACSELKMLVTSRVRLHVSGEYEFPVQPLAVPDPKHLQEHDTLIEYAAVALFVQRAQAIKPDFQLTAGNAQAIAESCLRLDGLPLAIELATARIKLLSPQALLARLSQRLQVLTGGVQDAPVRQQTLRNTIAWSYDLLDAQEQRLFRQTSVFMGGCTLKAIEAICTALDDGEGATPVLDAISSLIDKSLLQQAEQEGEEPRLGMLETIREYGLEMLAASGELDPTRHAHATYYLRLAEQVAPILRRPEQTVLLERLEQEHQNLRAVMQWWLEQGEHGTAREPALRLGRALREFWHVRGHYREGRSFLEQALAGSEGAAALVRAKALAAAASLADAQSDDARLEVLAQESLALYRQLGVRDGIANALCMLGTVAWRKRGDFRAARALFEESVKLFKEAGDQQGTAWALWMLADTISNQGEHTRGLALYEECLALFRALGNKRGIAMSLCLSAQWIFVCQGDKQTVRARLEASLALFKELGDQMGIALCLWFSGWAMHQDDPATAQTLLEESVKLFREIGVRFCLAGALGSLGQVAVRHGDLAAARAHFEESLEVVRAQEDRYYTAFGLEGLAEVAAAQGHPAWAARLWGAAETLREGMGIPALPVHLPVERAVYEQAVASLRMQLGERAFAAAWAEGRSMTPEQAVAAQGQAVASGPSPAERPSTPPAKASSAYPAGLTAREVEVLRLVAGGLNNAQIAEQLVISPRTVNGHLSTIYSKLQVSSRSAATRYAIEQHLA